MSCLRFVALFSVECTIVSHRPTLPESWTRVLKLQPKNSTQRQCIKVGFCHYYYYFFYLPSSLFAYLARISIPFLLECSLVMLIGNEFEKWPSVSLFMINTHKNTHLELGRYATKMAYDNHKSLTPLHISGLCWSCARLRNVFYLLRLLCKLFWCAYFVVRYVMRFNKLNVLYGSHVVPVRGESLEALCSRVIMQFTDRSWSLLLKIQ